LLLLDESDRFLDQDSKNDFVHTARLKGVMDRTNRRFKVVLAGLHNVQRTTRLENNPLAHYGEPICIGPLMENGEWKEAWQLVEQPFASIGYRFGSPDLITRILSQTNYYPSLIQLYCNQLLRHMLARPVNSSNPPYTISSQDVEEAYQSGELRKSIRDRFTWTLDLDPRYRLIAFCLALYSCEEPDRADRGFSVSWIRDQVLTFWPKGFGDIQSEDTFHILLDEMVGLGVLRVAQDAQYALRSLSVISLLGTKEEIETELESFLDREPPRPYDAATFRSSLRGGLVASDSAIRNPLTAAQQSELQNRTNGVSIIFGCGVSGLEKVESFLVEAFAEDSVVFDGIPDFGRFSRGLDDLDRRNRDGVTLFLVQPTCAWTPLWVTEALKRIGKLTSKKSYARLVFIADPSATWSIIPEVDTIKKAGANLVSLTPWHDAALQHWLDETGFANVSSSDRVRINEVTGNWPVLLNCFHQRCGNILHIWRHVLDQLDSEISGNLQINGFNLEKLFGVNRQEARLVLSDLAILEEASADELSALNSAVPVETADHVLKWAALLSLVQPSGNERFRIDSILGRVLRS
jgi:hypothetical protein